MLKITERGFEMLKAPNFGEFLENLFAGLQLEMSGDATKVAEAFLILLAALLTTEGACYSFTPKPNVVIPVELDSEGLAQFINLHKVLLLSLARAAHCEFLGIPEDRVSS